MQSIFISVGYRRIALGNYRYFDRLAVSHHSGLCSICLAGFDGANKRFASMVAKRHIIPPPMAISPLLSGVWSGGATTRGPKR